MDFELKYCCESRGLKRSLDSVLDDCDKLTTDGDESADSFGSTVDSFVDKLELNLPAMSFMPTSSSPSLSSSPPTPPATESSLVVGSKLLATQQTLNIAFGPQGQLYALLPAMETVPEKVMVPRPKIFVSEEGNRLSQCDDKRRATHNEVERRRRDKINTLIMKLAKIIPDCPTSKSDILCRACDYVSDLQRYLTALEEKFEKAEVGEYDRQIEVLSAENMALRAVLERNGIPVPEFDESGVS
ncbi:unnamed protein product [Notodromas monacha]|uniref:BHLH domain-containing protein n=1 Tax=Notodromas monacha TaxID=399045 RepID=A0A7R9BN84_9CRUS|nr:unnamed protein product [Notodromas monacha]CAG0917234.1 unnamed protein product [Notodromas monacha]